MEPVPSHHHPKGSICDTLEAIVHKHPEEEIKIAAIVKSLHEQGFGLLMALLVLPNCVPIPVPPGVSTVLSIPLLLISLQMALGRRSLWLPRKLSEKKLKRTFLLKMIGVLRPRLARIERLIKPRMAFASSRGGEILVGMFWVMFSASIAVPIPMTNFLPGMGILISALGLINRDGHVVLLGFLVGTVGVFVTMLVLLIGAQAITRFFGF